jgi:hypothetical protein
MQGMMIEMIWELGGIYNLAKLLPLCIQEN